MKRHTTTFAASVLLASVAGCGAAMVFDVAGHSAALADCRAEGKDAGSIAVYSQCADEADRKYMPDGGAP